jgi:hypothetical protein
MDWLLPRQSAIETRLASRHLKKGDLVFLDTSSSYYERVKTDIPHSILNKKDLSRFGLLFGWRYKKRLIFEQPLIYLILSNISQKTLV